MKVRKPIWGFLILFLLTAVFAIVIHAISSIEMIRREDDRILLKINGVAKTLDSLEVEIADAIMKNNQRKDALLEMMELSLKTFMQYGRYNGPEIFEDGFVVRIDGDRSPFRVWMLRWSKTIPRCIQRPGFPAATNTCLPR